MWEWLSDNWWASWLVAAALLALTESLTLDFTLLMLAAGALAGAGVALLFLLRPTLLEKVRSAPGYRSALQRMVGSTGQATTAITGNSGEVKVNGEVWRARSFGDVEIEAGASVEVFEVDGITVVVYPKEP